MNDLKNITPQEDFDWEAYEGSSLASEEQKKIEEAYGESFKQVAEHEVVKGTVIAINKREVLVDIGYKSDGVINANPAQKKVGTKLIKLLRTKKLLRALLRLAPRVV